MLSEDTTKELMMSEKELKQKKVDDQELRFKAIVLKDPEASEKLHAMVLGQLFCEEALAQTKEEK